MSQPHRGRTRRAKRVPPNQRRTGQPRKRRNLPRNTAKKARPRRRRGSGRPSGGRRWFRYALGFGALIVPVLTILLALEWFARRPGPALEAAVAVGWPEGLDAADAAQLLTDLGLVSNRTVAEAYLRTTSASQCFRAGAHLLPRQASPAELRQLLCRTADRPTAKLTVPEGYNRFDIAARLERLGIASRQAFLHASSDEAELRALEVDPAEPSFAFTAEGYLFPATYVFPRDSEPRRVLRRLVEEGGRRWRRIAGANADGLTSLREEFGWGRRAVLTLASMIEKEVGIAEERAIVASVFLNRLREPSFEPKLLQSDPTAVYGCLAVPWLIPACRAFSGGASGAVNRDPRNPYSTYVHTGLPPGPIANPGEAAIEAVLSPARTGYFYFVAAGDGRRHVFSASFEAHQRAVRRLRERRR